MLVRVTVLCFKTLTTLSVSLNPEVLTGILAKFLFCIFMDQDEVEVHTNTKKE